MQDLKSEASCHLVKLCFIVLTIISEDQYANALMSDAHLVFRVYMTLAVFVLNIYILCSLFYIILCFFLFSTD